MRRLIFVSLIFAGACNNNGFDPINYVSSLRLLDVKSTPAEVAGGMTATMTATWANPGKPTPTIDWDYCTLAAGSNVGSGIAFGCVEPDMAMPSYLHAIGSGETVSFTMPTFTIAQLGFPDATGGFYLPVRIRMHDDTQQLTSIFRLRIYPGSISPNPPNANPSIMGLYRVPSADAGPSLQMEITAASPPVVHNKDLVDLRTLLTPGSEETYLAITGVSASGVPTTQKKTETVSITWYSTAGEFTQQVTGPDKPDTTWKLDIHVPAPGSTIDMWIVALDERGGSDVIHRTFTLQ
jgi:hypothetical protein